VKDGVSCSACSELQDPGSEWLPGGRHFKQECILAARGEPARIDPHQLK
jgi:hypothetical protein